MAKKPEDEVDVRAITHDAIMMIGNIIKQAQDDLGAEVCREVTELDKREARRFLEGPDYQDLLNCLRVLVGDDAPIMEIDRKTEEALRF